MAIVGALPFTLQNGTTADATQVMADFNSIKTDVNTNAAKNGANNDITSLSGLTTPVPAASGGGLVLITSGTVAAATLDIVLTSATGYRGLKIFLSGFLPATDGAGLLLRFSTDGGSNYLSAANYHYVSQILTEAATAVLAGSSTGTSLSISAAVGSASNEGLDAEITIQNQSSAVFYTKANWVVAGMTNDATSQLKQATGSGCYAVAQDTDAVQFLFSSGNIAAGRYAVYGLA